MLRLTPCMVDCTLLLKVDEVIQYHSRINGCCDHLTILHFVRNSFMSPFWHNQISFAFLVKSPPITSKFSLSALRTLSVCLHAINMSSTFPLLYALHAVIPFVGRASILPRTRFNFSCHFPNLLLTTWLIQHRCGFLSYPSVESPWLDNVIENLAMASSGVA